MKKWIVLEKEVGQTPLETVTAWKSANPRYESIPASYAGRLDPMASGKLLVLLGDECKRQKDYTKLDKVYEIEVLLDIESDTGDILGKTTSAGIVTVPSTHAVKAACQKEIGTYTRAYPVYSSKTVGGKPLFLHALLGTLDTIDIPTHEETIYAIQVRGIDRYTTSELKERITSLLAHTPTSLEPSKQQGADFRIAEVRTGWDAQFASDRDYYVLRLRVTCGSGSYMRTLAPRLGKALGTTALALSICRTRIGKWGELILKSWM